MYGHHVIADLEDSMKRIPKYPNYRKHMELTVAAIKDAHHFHCGDLSFIYDVARSFRKDDRIMMFDGELAKDVNLPYEVCWFDINDDMSTTRLGMDIEETKITKQSKGTAILNGFVLKRGILVVEVGKGLLKITILSKMLGVEKWIPEPIQALVSVGRNFVEVLNDPTISDYHKDFIQSKELPENPDETYILFYYVSDKELHTMTTPEMQDYQIESLQTNILYLNIFLMLLNTQNIVTEVIEAPDKLNKKRRKKGKPPIFSYKILKIDLPNQYKKYEKKPHQGGENRIHFCRGHFKTYTDEKPLFGRVTGRFWIPRHVRGNKKKGVIQKEYTV